MATQFATYSFVDVSLALIGPGGALTIGGDGAGNAEEGFTVEMLEDKNTMTVGADGSGMHSLHAGNSGIISVRLLKTSTVNHQLQVLYDFQRLSSANWGQNTMTVRNPVIGDIGSARGCAFRKFPSLAYAKDGGLNEWSFMCIQVDTILGIGVPSILPAL